MTHRTMSERSYQGRKKDKNIYIKDLMKSFLNHWSFYVMHAEIQEWNHGNWYFRYTLLIFTIFVTVIQAVKNIFASETQ